MDCSTPGFPVPQFLLEFAQIHVCWVSDALHFILCCPLLLLPSIFPSISLFQCHLFASGGWSIGASASASVLPMNFRGWFPLGLTGLISLQSKRLLRVPLSWTKHPWYVRNLCFCLVQKSNCKLSLHCILILFSGLIKIKWPGVAIPFISIVLFLQELIQMSPFHEPFPISLKQEEPPLQGHTTFSSHIVVYHREPQYILPQAYYPSRLCTVQGGTSCNFS